MLICKHNIKEHEVVKNPIFFPFYFLSFNIYFYDAYISEEQHFCFYI